jgi:hypothetical protein
VYGWVFRQRKESCDAKRRTEWKKCDDMWVFPQYLINNRSHLTTKHLSIVN